MSKLNALTLKFENSLLESEFVSQTSQSRILHGRIAIILGVSLYLLFGALDRWLVPSQTQSTIWLIRLSAVLVPITVFLLTFTSIFRKASLALLGTIAPAASIAALCMLPLIPLEQLSLFYPSIAFATIAGYCLVATRFVYALAAGIAVFLAYNIIFISTHGFIVSLLSTHDFYLLSANVIGGGAGYLQELQNRKLFLRERELKEERQKHLERSLRDSLTGLPNRDLLHDRLKQVLAQSHRDGTRHAGYFIDLDGFKKVNDALGHEVGDKVLQTVATQLSSAVRESDTVARLGGDEFFVLIRDIENEATALIHAKRLLFQIENCAIVGMDKNSLSASIGVCLTPYPGATVTDLIARADKAMYRAKNSGRGRFLLAASPAETLALRRSLGEPGQDQMLVV
jgi:diguanylate cyclase